MQISTSRPQTGLWPIFITFLTLGIQSFGGGSATFFLIHQVCLQRGWMDEEEFLRSWALAQITPGINLVKLTALIGHKLRGWPGVICAMAGLLLPSALLTVLMTAGFALLRNQPVVQAAMRGILPATIGLSLTMAIQMAAPVLGKARKEGPSRLAVQLIVLVGSALLLILNLVSPVVILLLSGAGTVLLLAIVPARKVETPQQKETP